MCINSGKMMEMTFEGYPSCTSIVIRTSQSELPDLFVMYFFAYQYLVQKKVQRANILSTEYEPCNGGTDDCHTCHPNPKLIEQSGQSITLTETTTFLMNVLQLAGVDIKPIKTDLLEKMVTGFGIMEKVIKIMKEEAYDIIAFSGVMNFYTIPSDIVNIFSVVYAKQTESICENLGNCI